VSFPPPPQAARYEVRNGAEMSGAVEQVRQNVFLKAVHVVNAIKCTDSTAPACLFCVPQGAVTSLTHHPGIMAVISEVIMQT
jgi:hypothetical protein